jgi:hypothetical protein
MKNLNHFNHRISLLFQGHITGNLTLEELIKGLKGIEVMHRKSVQENGSLWFKFSEDDTMATTIVDLEKDLSDRNREFTLERIRESISLENELSIYYS